MTNPIAMSATVIRKIKLKFYRLYFYIIALQEYLLSAKGWRGGYRSRLQDLRVDLPEDSSYPRKIAIFVGYSHHLTLSTGTYLEALRSAGFSILYLGNHPISSELQERLSKVCWKLFERCNIGRDFGAFKDGVLWTHRNMYLERCDTLLIANDSMQFIPGANAASLVKHLKEFDQSSDVGLFSHISHVHDTHYQSFFQVLKYQIFRSRSFINYWTNYLPLSHRGHCIFQGEIALSQQVYRRFSNIRVLYSSLSLVEAINSNRPGHTSLGAQDITRLMPSPARTLQRTQANYILSKLLERAEKNECVSESDLFLVSELIENNNPSHIGAFLFPLFLGCPLVKQDLCSAGSFSIAQASALFKEILIYSNQQNNVDSDDLHNRVSEFILLLNQKGTPLSHMNKPREAARKGITGGFIYAGVYDGN